MQQPQNNIVLIGMPGVGKSTAGVVLAKRLSMDFLDTDIYIQRETGQSLHNLIAKLGIKGFCQLEDELVAKLKVKGHVIATGGSVVYGANAMAALKKNGCVLWLNLPYAELASRLEDLDARGVVMEPGQSLEQLYNFRKPYYAKYADGVINTLGMNIDRTVAEILHLLEP